MNNQYQWGSPESSIAFIAEAPGKNEMEKKQPLVGSSGSIFDVCLHSARINRRHSYIGNVCREQISSGAVVLDPGTNKRKPEWTEKGADEYNTFVARLSTSNFQANVLVAMGNIALFALTGQTGISKFRGSVLKCTVPGLEDRKVIPTYHPAATLRGKSIWKNDIIIDFVRAKREAENRDFPDLGGELVTHPSFDECMDLLDVTKGIGYFAHDIECYNGHVSCMSFGYRHSGEALGYCVPFYDGTAPGKARWDVKKEQALWSRVGDLLTNPEHTVVGQNYIFDMGFMARSNGLLPTAYIEDTMVAHSIMYPDTPKGLDYLCSVYTNIPYYKEDRKLWEKLDESKSFQDKFWEYSAKDGLAQWLCWEQLREDLRDDPGYLQSYRNTMELYPVLLYMQTRGIKFDIDSLPKMRENAAGELEQKQRELDEAADYSFNPNSSKQCKEYFYEHKGIKPYSNRTGGITTDDDALRRIYLRDDCKEARICQEYRAIKKFMGDSLGVKADNDARIRCSMNPRGTRFGRLSSSKTIHGTGTNMQNRESRFKTLLRPDDDCAFFEFDLAGAEWVVVAYLSEDPRMIEVCESTESPHTLTANTLFNVPKDLVVAEDKMLGHLTDTATLRQEREKHFPELLTGTMFVPRNMTCRQGGKRCNHGFNYDFGYQSFATKYDIAVPEARKMHAQYRRIYNIEGYHRWVREQLRGNDRSLYNLLGRRYRFMGSLNDQLFKIAYSYVPQSTVGDLVNRGLRKVWQDDALYQWEPLMQVHDSALYQHSIKGADWRRMAIELRRIKGHLIKTLEFGGREFTIDVELKVSKADWSHMTEVPIDDTLADRLEVELG